MSIVRYRQWPAQTGLQNEIRQLFGALLNGDDQTATDDSAVVTAQWVPAVDIREEAGQFVLMADLPGIDPADIEVQMDKGILSIKGERKLDPVPEGDHFSRIERRHGNFHRRFALPDSADPDAISASGSNGVLEIRIPKRAEASPRRIQVETGNPTKQ